VFILDNVKDLFPVRLVSVTWLSQLSVDKADWTSDGGAVIFDAVLRTSIRIVAAGEALDLIGVEVLTSYCFSAIDRLALGRN
jgi:hypothetical protein